MNTSPAALAMTSSGWSSDDRVAGNPNGAGPAKPRPATPVPAIRLMSPLGVISRTVLSPESAMNTSPLASSPVPPGWYSDAAAAAPPSPCSPNADSDPAIGVVLPPATVDTSFAPVFDTNTVPLPADTPAGRYSCPPSAGAV